MPKQAHARRYAQAIFEIALEQKELDKWQTDLEKVAGIMADADFQAAMESPKIRFDDKSRFVAERLKDVSPLVLNLVRLLIVRNGIGMVGEINAEYQRLLDAYHGVQKAEVVTAVPIDDRDKEKLAANLGALVDAKIVVESRVDPEILGGVIARVGGKLLDGSTRSKLVALKHELVSTGRKI